MTTHVDPRTYLSVRELADRWRTSAHAIHVRRWRGDAPPAVKIGSRVLFATAEVEAYEAARRSANTSDGGHQ